LDFRKNILKGDQLTALEEKQKGVLHKPAQLYKYKRKQGQAQETHILVIIIRVSVRVSITRCVSSTGRCVEVKQRIIIKLEVEAQVNV
jgi:hypothetical protein